MEKVTMFNGNNLEIGDVVRFWDIWSEDGDEEEILESGAAWVANDENGDPVIADFEVIEIDKEEIGRSLIKITDLR